MNDLLLKLQILSRTEKTLFRLNMHTAAKQVILLAVGIVLILLAVAMFNVALFMSLSKSYGYGTGGLIVCAVNAVLAVVVFSVAARMKPGPEAEMAREIRDIAVKEINSDIDTLQDNLYEVKTDVKRISSGLDGLLGKGDGSPLGLLSLGPLLDTLTYYLNKGKADE